MARSIAFSEGEVKRVFGKEGRGLVAPPARRGAGKSLDSPNAAGYNANARP